MEEIICLRGANTQENILSWRTGTQADPLHVIERIGGILFRHNIYECEEISTDSTTFETA